VPEVIPPTARTTVRRQRERGSHERAQIHAILDEGMICHVAVCVDGTPWAIPTAYGRDGDVLYLHGAAGNHVLRAAASGGDICVTVSLLDGVVLARSSFHHSLNYRSVVVFGPASEVTGEQEKRRALDVIVEHLLPGRSREARPPSESELRQTRVLGLALTEASAKLRSGPPIDDDADVGLPVWAGVLPLRLAAGAPQPDPANRSGLPDPAGLVQPRRWGAPPEAS
jgi:nitroimidazol reductase NimA-like FMN-containing flavoprotein (pyridoxamine 5'-phosphate oxidase superfamily)